VTSVPTAQSELPMIPHDAPLFTLLSLSFLPLFTGAAPAAAQAPIDRVSVDSLGLEADDLSEYASISDDGRFVAFSSRATDLVPGDTNGFDDVFVHDRQTGATLRASVSSAGGQGSGHSRDPAISGDGRYVTFQSFANNLVPNDTNTKGDVFVRDLLLGTTQRVSVSTGGVQGDQDSRVPDISGDGRFVAFASSSSTLVPGDTGHGDVFVRDRLLGTTERVSYAMGGAQPDHASDSPSISADGRFVAFDSIASNLVPGDTNLHWDVFVRDRQTGALQHASLTSAGLLPASDSREPSVSDDGRYVSFWSRSSLVSEDVNVKIDVYRRDLLLGKTELVSTTETGGVGTNDTWQSAISADGRYVAIRSWSKLLPEDTNGFVDVYVRDMDSAVTVRANKSASGDQANGHSDHPAMTSDGTRVAFSSFATNLVAGDTNAEGDVFSAPVIFPPRPDVRANGESGEVTLTLGTPLFVTVALDAGTGLGDPSEWWVRADTPFGTFWLQPTLAWIPSATPLPLLAVPMLTFPPVPVLNGLVLPPGVYAVTFFVDAGIDGAMDGTWSDTVTVTVQ
jgi:Tol biopolymer transport system component